MQKDLASRKRSGFFMTCLPIQNERKPLRLLRGCPPGSFVWAFHLEGLWI